MLKPPLLRQWQADLGAPAHYPIIADGRLFATAGPLLYAFDLQTGTRLWGPIDIGGPYAWASYDSGRLFVENYYNFLRAFDPASGHTLWLEQLPDEVGSNTPPVALNGTIYAVGHGVGQILYAVSESNGSIQWAQTGCPGCPYIGDHSSPAVTSTAVFIDGDCGWNYRLDPTTGNEVWGTSGVCTGGGGLTPALYQGRFYSPRTYPNPDDLDVLDATTGAKVGSFKASQAPAFSGSSGFFLDYGTLTARDLISGTAQWTFTGDGSLITSPVFANGYVYVGSSQGRLYAIDATSGTATLIDTVLAGMQGETSNSFIWPGLAIGQGMLAVPAGNTLTVYGTGTPPGPPGPPPPPPLQTFPPPPTGSPGAQTTFQVDATHSGWQSADTTTPPLGYAWARDFGSTPSTPLIAGRSVFVAASDPVGSNALSLYALDLPTGAIVWGPVAIGPPMVADTYQGIAYDNGELFVATPVDSNGGLLRAFDATNGHLLWSQTLAGQWVFDAPPVAFNGVVYAVGAGFEATIYAFRETDGWPLWNNRSPWLSETMPAVTTGGLYFANPCMAWDFDPKTGAQLWVDEPGCTGGGATTPVLSGNAFYSRTWDVGNASVDPQTGVLLGTYSADRTPAFFGSMGFFPLGSQIMGEDLASNTVDWSFDGDGSLANGPLVVNGYLYIGSSDGKLYALHPGDGSTAWSTDVRSILPRSEDPVSGLPNAGFSAGGNMLLVPALNRLVAYAPCTNTCAPAPIPTPVVTSISPTGGGSSGGTYVYLYGSGFTNASGVKFGDTPAESFTVNTERVILAKSPPGSGTVDVTVTSPGGTSATSSADKFTYVPSPIVTSITPKQGTLEGGTRVTITGIHLGSTYGVRFGNTPAPTPSIVVSSDTQVLATSPPGGGTVDITVIADNGTSGKAPADQFTYIGPPIVPNRPLSSITSSRQFPPPVRSCRCGSRSVVSAQPGHASPPQATSSPPSTATQRSSSGSPSPQGAIGSSPLQVSPIQLEMDQLMMAITRLLRYVLP